MHHLKLILVALCATASPCMFGQSQSSLPSISGVVLDVQGSSIAGAQIKLTSQMGVTVSKTASDPNGRFAFPALQPGTYIVAVSSSGFTTLTKAIVATQDASLNLSLVLSIAPAQTTIVVTATRSARSIADVPASVSVVTGEQIEQTPARTIDDVLRRVPSVDLPIASTNEQHPTDTIVSMRGLSGIRSLVLLDGVPLNDPFFGFLQWSEAPVQTIDRVEVVRGAGSTLWGNYAMGGVINIITRPIDKTELVIESAGGSRGTYRTDGHAAFAGDRYGIGIDVGNSHSNGYLEQVRDSRGPIDVPTSFTADTIALSGNVNLSENIVARGRISHYSNAQNYLTRLQTNGEGTWRYSGELNWRATDRQTVDFNIFNNDERFSTNNTGAPDGADPTQVEYIQNVHRTLANDLGTALLWSKSFTGVFRTLSAGGDYHGVHGSDAARIFDPNNTYLRTDLGSGDQRFAGGFFQMDLRPLERLQILFSLRYQDFYSFNGVDNTPGRLGATVPTRHDSDVDPRLSVRYQLPGGFALRGAAYRAFRAPTLDNLYRSASVPGYILYSNASLSPETLNGGEVGFDFVRGTMRFQATAYDSHVSNLLTYHYLDANLLPPGFSIGARLINAGSATSRGFEVELNWQIAPHLNTLLSYTYADSIVTTNTEDPVSVGVQQPGIPKNRAMLGVNWSTFHDIQVSPHLRYLSRTSGDPDNIYHTDSHFIADLALTAPITKRVQALLQIENLLSRTYVGTNDGFTAPLYGKPFTAVAGFRLTLR